MPDLIEKYFRQDLTDAEEESLENLLGSSEDAAESFVAKAETAYFRYGLPEPGPSGTASWPRPGFGWMGLMAFLVVLLVWWTLCGPVGKSNVTDLTDSIRESLPDAQAPVLKAPIAAPQAVKKHAPIASEPPPIGGVPDKTYAGVKVIVRQETSGPVVVRVLDPSGLEVRRLYDGSLEAGQWSFLWDGVLKDGTAAKPGNYVIETNNGRTVLTKQVEIRPAKKPTTH